MFFLLEFFSPKHKQEACLSFLWVPELKATGTQEKLEPRRSWNPGSSESQMCLSWENLEVLSKVNS